MINEINYKLKDYFAFEVCHNKKINLFQFISRILFYPSYNAVFLIRLFLTSNNRIFKIIIYNKLINKYGIFIGNETKIGIGLVLGHPNGIIIGNNVNIGKNCTIYQQVTIGIKNEGDDKKGHYPRIGNNCSIGAGAKILGNICVGNNTLIGANAVLLKNTEENSVYAGIPARIMRHNKE
jgi:serine O-acetyltransferase